MKKVIYHISMFLMPIFVLAQTTGVFTNITANLDEFLNVFDSLIRILFALAICYFFWGVIKFIRASGNPKEATEGKAMMLWGIIALAVMVSVYGLINWLIDLVALENTDTIILPNTTGFN